MNKIKYLIKRLKNMSFKNLFKTVNELHKKTNKSRIILFLDIVYCGLKYQAGYMDYKLFEMYNLNSEQRKTIITRGINNQIVKKYNNPNYYKYFHNKLLFNNKFKKYLKRDYIEVNDTNFNEFKDFALKHKEIVIKPVDGSCGKGIEIVKVNNKNVKEIYNDILNTKRYLIEEKATQLDELASIHKTSINTMRVITLDGTVVAAYLRMGNKNNSVDNFNSEGLAAPINIKTGIIDYVAIDKEMNIYENHPISNIKIVGFKIPNWNKVINFLKDVTKVIPEIGYVGWDVSINENGPYLIEANEFPGHDIYQLPPHRTDGIGMLPVFKKAMKK